MDWGAEAERRLTEIAACSEATEGVTRLPFTPEHAAANDLIRAWMEQAGARYQKLADRGDTASSGAGNEALYALADRTAREAGLGDAIQGVTPEQDNRVRVNLSGVGFDAMVQWLATLRRDFQVRTATASFERIAEPGQVNARLVLSRGQQ